MYQMAEFPELKAPAIIAVMGIHQTAEREFICRMAARWARCSIYDIKGALDSLSEEEEATAGEIDEEEGARLQRVSFDIICRMADCHLPRYVSGRGCVIVSSNFFTCKLQLDRLIELTTRPRRDWPRRRLLIIECRRKNLFQWEQSIERDIEWKASSLGEKPKWHEPKSWKDVDKSIQEFDQQSWDDYFLKLARAHLHVKKLNVDPYQDLSPDGISLFEKAIAHLLMACDTVGRQVDVNEYCDDQSSVVEYAIWRRQQLDAFRVSIRRQMCSLGGCIFRFTENLHPEAICEVCEQNIASTERAYYCQFCSLSFHELCSIKTAYDGSWHTSKFSKTYACYSCIDGGKGFSDECTTCIFRTFIKSRILAPVLKHEGDEHNLSLCVLQGLRSVRLGWCNACGLPSHLAGYCCNICKSRYHWECLKLPLETKSEHGGHLHDVKLQFSCVKEDEHEWCLACTRDIDPETWVYVCLECDYVAHLYCIFPSIAEESQYEFE